jgi:hypothetical protein
VHKKAPLRSLLCVRRRNDHLIEDNDGSDRELPCCETVGRDAERLAHPSLIVDHAPRLPQMQRVLPRIARERRISITS